MADFQRRSNLSLEEHAARMEKLDPSPTEKNGLKERAVQWLQKMTGRGEKETSNVQSPEEVAKTKKIERAIFPVILELRNIDSIQGLEKIRQNIPKFLQEQDARTLTVRTQLRDGADMTPVRPTIAEQLTADEMEVAEKKLYKRVQEVINKSLYRLGTNYLLDVKERRYNWNEQNVVQQRNDLVSFLNRSGNEMHLRPQDQSFMPFEDQVIKALQANKTQLAPDTFDYLHIEL